MFSKISSCTTQDEISKNRFKKLGVKNVDCSSNIKFLSNKLSFEKKDHLSFKKKLGKKTVITFFSTHKNEEMIIIDCFDVLSKTFKNLLFIIIPRHLKNSYGIEKNLKKKI